MIKNKIYKILLYILLSTVGVYVVILLSWVFVYDTYSVNSYSMYPTIKPGDKIIVNKLILGARLYTNLDFDTEEPLKSVRVGGLRKIVHNDVVVFNTPSDTGWYATKFKINSVYIKRCIGVPGDSIGVRNGHYRNSRFLEKIRTTPIDEYSVKCLDSSVIVSYPYDSTIRWTITDFGPLYIPKKGDVIILNRDNFVIYKKYIEYETSAELTFENGMSYVNGVKYPYYTFNTSYYFMAGDNAVDSRDSRYFGLVPEEFIIGVASNIIYSKPPHGDKIRLERTFLKL